MNKAISVIFLATVFSGCGGSSSGTSNDSDPNDTKTVSGTDGSVTISSENTTDLSVSGINNTIYIESNIGILNISGIGNLFYFSSGVEVEQCNVSGTDNFAEKEPNVSLNCSGSGIENIGF